jgi:hypothetical protein
MSENLAIFGGVTLVFILIIGWIFIKNRKSDRLNKALSDFKSDILNK